MTKKDKKIIVTNITDKVLESINDHIDVYFKEQNYGIPEELENIKTITKLWNELEFRILNRVKKRIQEELKNEWKNQLRK